MNSLRFALRAGPAFLVFGMLMSSPAQAMMLRSPATMQAAIEEASLAHRVVHRGYPCGGFYHHYYGGYPCWGFHGHHWGHHGRIVGLHGGFGHGGFGHGGFGHGGFGHGGFGHGGFAHGGLGHGGFGHGGFGHGGGHHGH